MSVPEREARIRLDVLAENLTALRRAVAPARVLAVVKADAYGHGVLPVAGALADAGADWLGVADLAEAVAIREAGIRTPLLAWLHATPADFREAARRDIDVAVSSPEQLDAAADAGAVVHLKLDTGLSRNGIAPDDAERVFARAVELERAGRTRVRGLMSHLSGASPQEDELQRARFAALVDTATAAGLTPELRHLAASLAALTAPDTRLDLVRFGIALYGVAPDDELDLAVLRVRPVMELVTRVAAVRRVPAGTGVSYGFVHRTDRPTTLALVPLGYADGVPRHASGRAEVAIGGVRHPQVGRIAMDQFVVDVGDHPVSVGDEVVLWGDPADGVPSASDWARASGTIGYEIVTRVGPRVVRTARP
ncbi:alanine racemase [Homoserinibacter sp. GY 40078]|uniref:alanine racemase n=1 Tax=Homoserinibacter sp. GY 40078 TaxID=2603275 RepID=UPI0011C6EC5F|nr:alanine racemase [Homoserinibacter sp. GY 40078]TXK19205.1 alanine racemase [Homoserinibacter sp. GY 40078]